MTKNYFQELAAELGWKAQDTMAFGLWDGYPFSLEFDNSDGGSVFYARYGVQGSTTAVAKALHEEKIDQIDWYAEDGGEDSGGILLGIASLPSDFYAKGTLHTLMEKSTGELKAAGLAPGDTCPLCGLAGADCHAYLNGAFRACHAACLDHRLNLPEEDTTTPVVTKGHYITGVVGALLGGAISAVPNLVQALNKGTVNSVLYAFIPIMAILLYRLLRGKASRTAASLIIFFCSLVVAFCLELVWYWFAMAAPLGYEPTLAYTTGLFFATTSLPAMLHGMVFGLVFMAVGFIPTAVLVRGYAADGKSGGKKVRGSRFVRQSAQPISKEDTPDTAPSPSDGE